MSTTPMRLDKYELREQLGHGGVAEVWKAFDTQLQRFVAIKVLHPNLREDPTFFTRFQLEAQLIASLHHPNIVQIHDFRVYQPVETEGSSAPIAYMVMDYVEGQTLADYIRNTSYKGQIPTASEIVNLFTSISLAIDYAHQKGMIHRDIKPANILLDRGNTAQNPIGEPILTDFGVAKLMGISTNTQSGTQLGTPLYTSPEQARGYPGNEQSDLYSLGVILYEMVTGVPPFRGETAVEVLAQHINATPTAPTLINPNIPPTLALVIMRGIAKDPASRFSSASAMTAALAEALNLPVPERLGPPGYPPDMQEMPTHITPLPPRFSSMRLAGTGPNVTPILPREGLWSGAQWTPAQPSQPGLANPISQPGFTPVVMPPGMTPTAPPPFPPIGPTASLPPSPSRTVKWQQWLYIALAVSAILTLVLGGIAAYRALSTQPKTLTQMVGRAFYLSSGQLNLQTAQGIADQLQIDLHSIPQPQAGNSYHAWLLGDLSPEPNPDIIGTPRPVQPPILITNNLPVQNGNIHYLYSEPDHNNLISATSRLLITEQPDNENMNTPPSDRSTWRYYAEIPQDQIPGDNKGFSALVHIRHLFYNETNIKVLGLPGGLDVWAFRNTGKLLESAVSARDDWHGASTNRSDMDLIKALLLRILDYLDGQPNVQIDVPPGTLYAANPALSRVALLTVSPQLQSPARLEVDPPGYVDHIQLHVDQVSKATDIPPETRQLTASILDDVNNAKIWLTKTRLDVLKLIHMVDDPAQIQQAEAGSLLDDMVNEVTYAYIGQLNPTTNQVRGGILQAHYAIQLLATLMVTKDLPLYL